MAKCQPFNSDVLIHTQCGNCGTMVSVRRYKSLSTKYYHVYRGICPNGECSIHANVVIYEQEKETLSELIV